MKPLKSILAIFLLPIFFFSACSKSSENPPPKTKTELLTQGSWKFDHAMAGTTDISSAPPLACYTDNTMTFSTNLTGTITEGANVCATPAPSTFTWSFQNNETTLRFSFTLIQGGSQDFTIVSLTETNLVLSQQMTIAPLPPTTVEVTFKH
jgi:hypothetical protein